MDGQGKGMVRLCNGWTGERDGKGYVMDGQGEGRFVQFQLYK